MADEVGLPSLSGEAGGGHGRPGGKGPAAGEDAGAGAMAADILAGEQEGDERQLTSERSTHALLLSGRMVRGDSLRDQVGDGSCPGWALAVASRRRRNTASGYYSSLVDRCFFTDCRGQQVENHVEISPATFDVVSKDVGRSFSGALLESDSAEVRAALQRVLLAFAVHNQRVGYCQGMNFIVAFSLTQLHAEEEDAFWLLVATVELLPVEFYMTTGLEELMVFQAMLRRYVPELATHLGDNFEVTTNLLAIHWLLPLFVHELPPAVTVAVWKQFFTRDALSSLLRTSLVIVKTFLPPLLQRHAQLMARRHASRRGGRTAAAAAASAESGGESGGGGGDDGDDGASKGDGDEGCEADGEHDELMPLSEEEEEELENMVDMGLANALRDAARAELTVALLDEALRTVDWDDKWLAKQQAQCSARLREQEDALLFKLKASRLAAVVPFDGGEVDDFVVQLRRTGGSAAAAVSREQLSAVAMDVLGMPPPARMERVWEFVDSQPVDRSFAGQLAAAVCAVASKASREGGDGEGEEEEEAGDGSAAERKVEEVAEERVAALAAAAVSGACVADYAIVVIMLGNFTLDDKIRAAFHLFDRDADGTLPLVAARAVFSGIKRWAHCLLRTAVHIRPAAVQFAHVSGGLTFYQFKNIVITEPALGVTLHRTVADMYRPSATDGVFLTGRRKAAKSPSSAAEEEDEELSAQMASLCKPCALM
eukprot:PLAT3668.1.p1 GENE.PLAT3668.1~~PLAT3668.1.p1  ORF type:complete len:713 (+),score=381.77 PLAT3668.1:21-2159(+)